MMMIIACVVDGHDIALIICFSMYAWVRSHAAFPQSQTAIRTLPNNFYAQINDVRGALIGPVCIPCYVKNIFK